LDIAEQGFIHTNIYFWQGYRQFQDSVIRVLKENPSYNIAIAGHAYKTEGINPFCERLGAERSDMVRQYLLSRQLNASRIKSIKNYGTSRPLNPGKNPLQILANARAEISFIYQ
jgi:outer membrane protein OmpA-like peptidoglycan-associated protein